MSRQKLQGRQRDQLRLKTKLLASISRRDLIKSVRKTGSKPPRRYSYPTPRVRREQYRMINKGNIYKIHILSEHTLNKKVLELSIYHI